MGFVTRRLVALATFGTIVAVGFAVSARAGDRWSTYGVAVFALLALKLVVSFTNRRPAIDLIGGTIFEDDVAAAVVGAIVPVHNEDPAAIRLTVDALTAAPNVDRIVVIDDASTDAACIAALDLIAIREPKVELVRFASNRGKREGLLVGAERLVEAGVAFIVTVDSDTHVLDGSIRAAVAELVASPATGAVTGMVRAKNWKRNLLTRLQDLRYASSFLSERAAYSRAGAVLCVCGSFTLWRAKLLAELVGPLTQQVFLGSPATYGDDRHLTNLALSRRWRIRFTEAAVAETLVPERMGHWIRQQVRWSKSFIRESLWAVKHLPPGWALTLTFMELCSWVVFTTLLVAALVVSPFVAGATIVVAYLVWASIMGFARSVRYFEVRPDATMASRTLVFVLAPLYSLLHISVVLPLRVWALASIRQNKWGTRSNVEVVLAESVS